MPSPNKAPDEFSPDAVEQFILLRDDGSYQSRANGIRWLKESPEHVAEFLRMERMYRLLKAMQLEATTEISALVRGELRQDH